MSKQSAESLDFDEEARKLWDRLNIDPNTTSSGQWNPLDPIWRHPTGGGTIYVGNQTAAANQDLLAAHGITHVVNCTIGASQIPNFFEKTGQIRYYRFSISHWQMYTDDSDQSIDAFTKDLFGFIEQAVASGESVMVHCLAGAHRAGTTGCACLIYFADMDVRTAIRSAKKCRSIIDPIGSLPDFLVRLQRAKEAGALAGK